MNIKKVKRKIDTIFIHCSDTRTDQNFGVKDFRKWHMEERGWSDVGYHYVIRLNGTIEEGRPLHRIGAHAGKRHNSGSIGICFEGGLTPAGEKWDEPLKAQLIALGKLLQMIQPVYGILRIRGHYEVSTKSCPNFNIKHLYILWKH